MAPKPFFGETGCEYSSQIEIPPPTSTAVSLLQAMACVAISSSGRPWACVPHCVVATCATHWAMQAQPIGMLPAPPSIKAGSGR